MIHHGGIRDPYTKREIQKNTKTGGFVFLRRIKPSASVLLKGKSWLQTRCAIHASAPNLLYQSWYLLLI
jgi:hypothetical protein